MTFDFSKLSLTHLHDIIFGLTSKSLTDVELDSMLHTFPDDLQQDIIRWGLSDTVVRENIFEYLTNNQISIL